MYFREDAKRPLSVSREQFEENWDKIFSKEKNGTNKADGTDTNTSLAGIDSCSGCKRSCYNLVDTVVEIMVDPNTRIEYVGYCTVRRRWIFSVFNGSKFNLSYADYLVHNLDNCSEKQLSVKNLLNQLICVRREKLMRNKVRKTI
jgi:hypothetical protein